MHTNELGTHCVACLARQTIDEKAARPRQAGILLREVVKYREDLGLSSWPCFLAGGKSRHPFCIVATSHVQQISTSTPRNLDTLFWPEMH